MGASKTRRVCGELCDMVSSALRVTDTGELYNTQ